MLGVPAKLAPFLFTQALSRLLLVYGAISIICAEALLLVAGIVTAEITIIILAIWIGCSGFALWQMMVFPTRTMGFIFLGMLSVGLVKLTWQVLSTPMGVSSTFFAPFALISFAMVCSCGVSVRPKMRVYWVILGFVLANASLWLGAVFAGMSSGGGLTANAFVIDYRFVAATLIIALAVVVVPRMIESNKRIQPLIDQRGQEVDQNERAQARAKFIAMNMHDTLLASLAVLSSAPAGPLSPALKADIENQLTHMHAFDYFDASASAAKNIDQTAANSAVNSAQVTAHNSADNLAQVTTHVASGAETQWQELLDSADALNVIVNINGESSQIERLTATRRDALFSALGQALANVARHSGQQSAELVVLPSAQQVIVTVIDSGKGFDPSTIPADRLGLRMSVIDRIESVGGTVKIMSSPDSGTAVLIHLPTGGQ